MAPPNVATGDAPTTQVGLHQPPAARQRDPPIFSGTGSPDIDDWLAAYERVSKFNAWDDSSKLNNVAFYLTELAKTWFVNHETEIGSWTVFRSRAVDLFGRPALRKSDAERKLSQRTQLADETFTSYIEDIISLCNRADPTMSESAKIKHILKGIAPDAFHMLVLRAPSTVQDVVAACQQLQDAKNLRVASPSLSFAPAIPLDTSNSDALRAFIRQVVKEEIARLSSACQGSPPSSHSLLALVQQEVSAALRSGEAPVPPRQTLMQSSANADAIHTLPNFHPPTLAQPAYRTYADVVRTTPVYDAPLAPATDYEAVAPVTALYPQGDPYLLRQHQLSLPPRRESRTCFYCGIRGHIARDCRRRRRDFGYDRMRTDSYGTLGQGRPMIYGRTDMPPNAGSGDRPTSPIRRRPRSPSPRFRDPQSSPPRNRSRSPMLEGNQ